MEMLLAGSLAGLNKKKKRCQQKCIMQEKGQNWTKKKKETPRKNYKFGGISTKVYPVLLYI